MVLRLGSQLDPDKQYAWLVHDWSWTVDKKPRPLSDEFNVKDKASVPQMAPMVDGGWEMLTEVAQWFWFCQMMYCAFGHADPTMLRADELEKLKWSWRGITDGSRAFTNKHGTNYDPEGDGSNGKDYISDERTDTGEMPKQERLTCGGNIVEITGELTRVGGKRCYPVRTLDYTKPLPSVEEVNYFTHPELIHVATISTPNRLRNGTWKVEPFHWIEWRKAHTPFPLVSSVQNYIEEKRLRLLKPGERIPSPYNEPYFEPINL